MRNQQTSRAAVKALRREFAVGVFYIALAFVLFFWLLIAQSQAGLRDKINGAVSACANNLDVAGWMGIDTPGKKKLSSSEVQEAKKLCENQKNKIQQKKQNGVDEKDPCSEASLKEKTSKLEVCAGGLYAVVAGVCAFECLLPVIGAAQVCHYGGYATAAVEITGALAVNSDAKELMSMFTGVLSGNLAGGGGVIGLAAGASYGASKLEKWKNFKDERRGPACIAAAFNVAQSTVRYINSSINASEAADAYLEKPDLVGGEKFGDLANANNNSPTGNNPSERNAPQEFAPGANRAVTEGKQSPADEMASSFVSAGFGPVLDAFDQLTDKPGAAKEVFARALAGTDPNIAAAQAMQGKIPDNALAGLLKVQKESAKFKDVLLKNDSAAKPEMASAFESGSGGGHAAKSDGGDGFPDLGALMAGLMPQKPGGNRGPQGPRGVAFDSNRAPANAEPIHPADQSIFDVIGTRYQFVQEKFLSGGDVLTGKPALQTPSSIPENIYLRK